MVFNQLRYTVRFSERDVENEEDKGDEGRSFLLLLQTAHNSDKNNTITITITTHRAYKKWDPASDSYAP